MNLTFDAALALLIEQARQNQAPTMPGPVVRSGTGKIEMLRWGFMSAGGVGRPPHLLINARQETVSRLPSFRDSWRHRRCLVVADYFYEWNQQTPKGLPKQPWRFARADDEPMVIAGIWTPTTLADGQRCDAYAVLTTAAAPTVAQIHDRMPVILHERDWPRWLDESMSPDELQALQRPYDAPMTALPVTPALNKSTYQGPVDEIPLPALQPPPPQAPEQGMLF